MKRTYRSKKEMGGYLDPRDVMRALDERASVFDAFSIQNIKQTKREMSVGASMFAASNKVRKRKYVKRLKDQEPIRESTESTSRSAYLTPDKSIRLKRAPDPFDLLLNSPTTSKVSSQPVYKIFSPMCTKRKGKSRRKKASNKKKYNYSSSEMESEKESHENLTDVTSDVSNVLSHKLEIEVAKVTPSDMNDSIKTIEIEDVLLFNKSTASPFTLNVKDKFSSSFVKSPLCSTPFSKKYRGKSIYKFSPISNCTDANEHNITTELEKSYNDKAENINNSVKNKTKPFVPDNNASDSPIFQTRNVSHKNKLKEEIFKHYQNLLTCKNMSLLEISEEEPFLGFSNAASTQNTYIQAIRNKCKEMAEYTDDDLSKSPSSITVSGNLHITKNSNNDVSNSDKTTKDFNACEINESQNNIQVLTVQYEERKHNNANESNNKAPSCVYLNKDSFYVSKHNLNEKYTLESSQTYSENNSIVENIVSANEDNMLGPSEIRTEKLSNTGNDNSLASNSLHLEENGSEEKHHASKESISELSHIYSEQSSIIYSDKCSIVGHENILLSSPPQVKENDSEDNEFCVNEYSISEISQNSSKRSDYSLKTNASTLSNSSGSLYESCNSENEITEVKTPNKELAVVIERLNDSILEKYYTKEADSTYGTLETEDMNAMPYCNSISSYNENDTVLEISATDEECHVNISQVTSHQDQDLDFHYENNKSDDDIFVSFVTRRRRNEVTKDSFILSFDNSLTSASSAGYDKTVISNHEDSLNILNEFNDNTLLSDAHINNKDGKTQLCSEHLVQKDDSIKDTDIHTVRPLPKIKRPSEELSSVEIRKSCELLDRVSYAKEVDQTSRKSVAARKTRKSRKISKYSTDPQDMENDSSLKNSVVPSTGIVTRRSSRLYRKSDENTNLSVDNVTRQISNITDDKSTSEVKQGIVLEPGKRWERSLSIYRRMTTLGDHFDQSVLEEENISNKGRKYRQSVINTMEMQDISVSLHNESIRSRFIGLHSKPSRSTIKIVRESNASRISLSSTLTSEDLGFLTEDCDDTVVELSKLSIIDCEHEVTVLDKFNDSSNRITTARDYVLRRCNQTDVILFDECYPDTALKNCRKIGEGVYGEVFLWRAGDGRARVLKIVPIAGDTKVNGESQKDYHEIISEIVIAMELSALRAPIIDIEKHFDEGQTSEALDLHCVENATDVFNEVLAVRCVYGNYPSRLLDLWELYDESKGSDNDNPAVLPREQQFMVLELANAGQDLECYQFHNAEQAYALFKQVAFGLAVAEEAFQFEHRDLHWGNVLIAPTEQKYATFVLRGRVHRVARRGVAATVIDYSLSRLSLRLPSAESAALYNDLGADDGLFDAVGDYQFEVYRLMRDKLGNDWKNFEPYTNILWLHYTVDKMITALRYTRTNTKVHKHYIAKLKEIKNRILDYGSAVQYVLTDNEL